MNIGALIKQKRIELGYTLEELGNLVGVGKSTVRKWENGMIENMGRDKISLLAKALNISPLMLLGLESTNETPPSTINNPLIDELVAIAKQLTDHELEQLIAIAKTFIK